MAAQTYNIGLDGVVSVPTPFALSGTAPFVRSTFTDSGTPYTVNDLAAFDGTTYFLITGAPAAIHGGRPHLHSAQRRGVDHRRRRKTYLGPTTGPLSPNQFPSAPRRSSSAARPTSPLSTAQHYYAIPNGQFTDTNTGNTYTLSGNTAVHEGNSYEIFSNLGLVHTSRCPAGRCTTSTSRSPTPARASGDIFSVFPVSGGGFTMPLRYTIAVAGGVVTVDGSPSRRPDGRAAHSPRSANALTGGYFTDPVTQISYTCVVDGSQVTFIDSNNTVYPFPAAGTAS